VQVDPIKPKLKLSGTKRFKLMCDKLLSTSAFKFNLRRYSSALYTLIYFEGKRFTDMCMADHAAARRVGVSDGGGGGGGGGSSWGAAAAPAGGLRELLVLARQELPGHTLGRAVQVDSIKPKLKAPGSERLKLRCVESLSIFAFKFNLRRYSWDCWWRG